MNKNSSQFLNFLFISLGGALLIYQLTGEEREDPYFLILGLVLLMFGLYRATNWWVETKDDPNDDDNSEEN
ncbi:MAG TPA: hypothetical protein VFM59_07605 [Salinimicrobium sp.]|nr:hypothetical protein [Salinimicrobium sp.]